MSIWSRSRAESRRYRTWDSILDEVDKIAGGNDGGRMFTAKRAARFAASSKKLT